MGKEKWYESGLKFTCTQCGNCCSGAPGYVWATKEEIRKIATHIGAADEWLGKQHLRRVGLRYSLTEHADGDCVFLQRTEGRTLCSIHPVRPLQCRTWPFWHENLRSASGWENLQDKCPGVNKGRHYDYIQIEAIRTKKTSQT